MVWYVHSGMHELQYRDWTTLRRVIIRESVIETGKPRDRAIQRQGNMETGKYRSG